MSDAKTTTGAYASLIQEIRMGIQHSIDHVIDVVADEYMADIDRSGWIDGGGHCAEDIAAVHDLLAGTPLDGRDDIVDGVMKVIDEVVEEAKEDQITVWITNETTGRADLTEETQTSDDYVEFSGTPLELLERVVSLNMQGSGGSSWSLDAATALESFLIEGGHLEDQRFSVGLTDEEKALLEREEAAMSAEQGGGVEQRGYWWRSDDEVELYYSGYVTLVVTRREGPWEMPEGWNSDCWDRNYPGSGRVSDWDEWIDVLELPRPVRMRLWASLDKSGA